MGAEKLDESTPWGGYGDVAIETDAGKVWACVNIFLSVCLLGELFSTIDELRSQRKVMVQKVDRLRRRMDPDLLTSLLSRAKELRPKVQRDGRGLTELEFVLAMAIELKLLDWDAVRPFLTRFRSLDQDSDGRLGEADLQTLAAISEADRKKVVAASEGGTYHLEYLGLVKPSSSQLNDSETSGTAGGGAGKSFSSPGLQKV